MNIHDFTFVNLKIPKGLKKEVDKISFERKQNDLPQATINEVLLELLLKGMAISQKENIENRKKGFCD